MSQLGFPGPCEEVRAVADQSEGSGISLTNILCCPKSSAVGKRKAKFRVNEIEVLIKID